MKNIAKTNTTKTTEKSSTIELALATADVAIRKRAYNIYLETGSHDEHANWIKAENEHNSM